MRTAYICTMKALLISFFLIQGSLVFSQTEQDSILLLNGKVYHGEILGMDEVDYDSVVKYKTVDKKGVEKTEFIETYRIFSYTRGGTNHILYYQDDFQGNYLSVAETKDVTMGSYDARKMFQPHFPFWSGFVLGLGASVWDTYVTKKQAADTSLIVAPEAGFFNTKSPTIFPFFVPVVLSVTWALPTFKVKKKNMIHKEYFNNANYYRGYHRIAKQKRMLGALVGGLAGVASGMIIYYSVH